MKPRLWIRMGFGVWMALLSLDSQGDVVIFINGDTKYGSAEVLNATTVVLEVNGVTEEFQKKIVREIIQGVNEPAAGEIASSTDGRFVHKPSGNIYDITGDIATRKILKTPEGKELQVDIEKDFDISSLRLVPVTYSFYKRRGSYLVGAINNPTDRLWQAVEFRVSVYDESEKLVYAKDFYVYRLPPAANGRPGRRTFELALPDVPFERVHRIRVVRKF